ncbi:hypothetical protein [Flavobacterium sp.]|uniref:hypothetical protein n=1 Tax=Flavobacterium sp. TaxID=239 RepID=UPI0038FD2D73
MKINIHLSSVKNVIKFIFFIFIFNSTKVNSQNYVKIKIIKFSFALEKDVKSCDYSYIEYMNKLYPFSIVDKYEGFNYLTEYFIKNDSNYQLMREISNELQKEYDKHKLSFNQLKLIKRNDIYFTSYVVKVNNLHFQNVELKRDYELLFESSFLSKKEIILPIRILSIKKCTRQPKFLIKILNELNLNENQINQNLPIRCGVN